MGDWRNHLLTNADDPASLPGQRVGSPVTSKVREGGNQLVESRL